jgi:hypothetical protein
MDMSTSIVALALAAVAATVIIEVVARTPMFVAILVLGLSALGTFLDPELVPRLTVGAFTIFLADAVFALIAGAAFVRLIGVPRLRPGLVGLVVLVALVLWSLGRGALVDIEAAVTEFRLPFYFLAGTAYFATVTPDPPLLRRLSLAFVAAAAVVLVAAAIHWLALWAGTPQPSFMAPPYEPNFRVVGADRALVLAQALVVVLGLWRYRVTSATGLRWLAGLFLVAVFVLQHRTVWVTLVAAVVVALARNRGTAARIAVPAVLGSAVAALFAFGLFTGGAAPSLAESLGTQSTNTDTFFWRVEGWEALLEDQGGSAGDVLAGTPYGEGYRRTVAGQLVTVSPHNHYLATYLRNGLVGVLALLCVYGYGLVRLARASPTSGGAGFGDPDTMLVLLVTQLVFFIAYAPGLEQGIVLGLALALARREPPRAVAPVRSRRAVAVGA